MDELKQRQDHQGHYEDEINLLDLVKVILKHKKLIIKVVVAAVLLTAIVSLVMTKTYESRAVITPVQLQEDRGMSAVAAQFGIATPQSSNVSELVSLLKSNVLMQRIMEKHDLYRVFFRESELKEMGEIEKTWEGIRMLQEDVLKVTENKRENTITVAAHYKDQMIAQKVAAAAITELTEHVTGEAKRVAETNRAYLESQIDRTSDPYIKTNIYGLIARQIQTAMLAEAKENYAFKVLDPPIVPDKKIKPKRVQMVIIAFVVALLIGVFLAFLTEYVEKNREEWEELARMSGLKRFLRKRSRNKESTI